MNTKKLLSMALCLCMLISLTPASFAEGGEATCSCNTESSEHATNCPLYTAPETPTCKCAEKCADGAADVWCHVCGVQGAAACTGAEPQPQISTYTHTGKYMEGEEEKEYSLVFSYIADSGEAELSSYSGKAPQPLIPDSFTVDGKEYFVKSISAEAFGQNDSMKNLHLPVGVKSLKAETFAKCSALEFVLFSIEPSEVSVEDGAFPAGFYKMLSINGNPVIAFVKSGVTMYAEAWQMDNGKIWDGQAPASEPAVEFTARGIGNYSFTMPTADLTVAFTMLSCDHSSGELSSKGYNTTQHYGTYSCCMLYVANDHQLNAEGLCDCGFNSNESYTINVAAYPAEGGTVTGGGTYYSNETVQLSAAAAGDYVFTQWAENGTQLSADAAFSFSPEKNMNITAVFTQKTMSAQVQGLNSDDKYVYNGSAPTLSVSYGQDSLTETDYSVKWFSGGHECQAPVEPGFYSYTVSGAENSSYAGKSCSGQLEIVKKQLTAADFDFTAPENTVYDSTAKAAQVAAKTGVEAGQVTVLYFQGETQLPAAPTDAGTYSVKINVSESAHYTSALALTDSSWSFTVSQKTPEFTAPSGLTAIYGQKLSDITLPTATNGVWTWKTPADSVGNAGTVSHKAVFTPTDSKNLETKEVDVEIAVAKKEISLSAATIKAKTYDGEKTAEIDTVTISGLPENSSLAVDTDYTVTALFDDENAGSGKTVTVTLTLTGNAANNYDLKEKNSLTLQDQSISPKTITPTVTLSIDKYTYNRTERKPAVTVKDGTVTVPEAEYTLKYSDNINAGTAKVSIEDKENGNYSFTAVEKTFTIEKAKLTITASDLTIKAGDTIYEYYDEAWNKTDPAFKYVFKGLVAGDKLKDILVSYPSSTVSGDTATTGIYAINPSGADMGGNYDIEYKPGTIYVTSTGEIQYRTQFNTLNSVPSELGTLSAVKSALKAKLPNCTVVYYDLVYEMSMDGKSWMEVPDELFPKDGLQVVWPYTVSASTYYFKVAHMHSKTSTVLGVKAGEIETPTSTETTSGLSFKLKSASPLAIGYSTTPITADDSNMALWLSLMGLALSGMSLTAFCISRKKKKAE